MSPDEDTKTADEWLALLESREISVEDLERKRKDHGVNHRVISMGEALRRYGKIQLNQKLDTEKRRDSREEETLELARQANRLSRIALGVSFLAPIAAAVLTAIAMVVLAD